MSYKQLFNQISFLQLFSIWSTSSYTVKPNFNLPPSMRIYFYFLVAFELTFKFKVWTLGWTSCLFVFLIMSSIKSKKKMVVSSYKGNSCSDFHFSSGWLFKNVPWSDHFTHLLISGGSMPTSSLEYCASPVHSVLRCPATWHFSIFLCKTFFLSG